MIAGQKTGWSHNGCMNGVGSEGIAEYARLRLTVESVDPAGNGLADCVGILPDEDAADMRRIVKSEFEQVNLREW